MRSPETILKDLLIVAVLALSVTFGLTGYAQDKPDPGKDDKTVTLKIVTDDNGKVTVIDTTITTKGKDIGNEKEYWYQYRMKDMDQQMAEVEAQMRDLEDQMKRYEVEIRMGDGMKDLDSIVRLGDSIEKHMIIRGMGPDCKRPCPPPAVWFGDDEFPEHFNFDFRGDDFDFPEYPISRQWESLLQSIPMGKIKGFQVKDRKGGKRIIIDIDDEAPVVIMAPYRHHGSGHGYGQKKVVIKRDLKDLDIPPPPPPPPPAEPPKETPKPNKG